ncbi:hypothetical protein GMORB2_2528 [Geosmithia morbida]|uniref:LITAF domain-containing protein n=1 Tax=Geosmithia morbida TaxID=1094350 RepID=A0A9P4YSJ5_9HYPO|nr:uncharacterized protein GMORB2_2528 [Geosmithia morbida]KAF4121042.1 hypothetical protein GMORB2_2528 [Geosmithia morbida]
MLLLLLRLVVTFDSGGSIATVSALMADFFDYPPGYVPGKGFEDYPHKEKEETDDNVSSVQQQQQQVPSTSGPVTVPLTQLSPTRQQWIDCPGCSRPTRTSVEGRSEGRKLFMNVFWWPLPNRKHWWEKTHWYCSGCRTEVAVQKRGEDLRILI